MAFAEQQYDVPPEPSLQDTAFTVSREVAGASVRLVLAGELDMSTAPVLEDALRDETLSGSSIVIDLDRLDFIDSSGIMVLVRATKEARRSNRTLAMTRGSAAVQRVIAACVLEQFLPFAD
jgi:anti-sigma B factor antagonist